MSKERITHRCGHEVVHQLFGKHKGFGGRDSKIEWLGTIPCMDCKRKQEAEDREIQNARAAEANKSIGACDLKGSPAQIGFAESLRRMAFSGFANLLAKIEVLPEKNLLVESEIKAALGWLFTKDEASWWIDNVKNPERTNAGPAAIFALIDGKIPAASEMEIVRHLLLESPYLTEEVANILHLGESFRGRAASRLAASAQSEMKKELESKRPARPQVLAEARAKFGDAYRWNGKIYSGRRIFICNAEIKLTPEQEKQILDYQKERVAFLAEEKRISELCPAPLS